MSAVEQSIKDAVERLLDERGLSELSVAQILSEAGVSRTTYYAYFTNRDAAFLAVATTLLEGIGDRIEAVLTDPDLRAAGDLRRTARSWIAEIEPRRGVLRSAMDEWPRVAELREVYLAQMKRLASALAAAIAEDRERGDAPSGVPADELASVILWSAERTVSAALVGAPGLQRPTSVIDALVTTYRTAIYGPATVT